MQGCAIKLYALFSVGVLIVQNYWEPVTNSTLNKF